MKFKNLAYATFVAAAAVAFVIGSAVPSEADFHPATASTSVGVNHWRRMRLA